MSKILITGSTGLVGSACVSFFLEKDWEVVGLDNNMRAKFFGTDDKPTENPIDIRDIEKLEQGFKDFGPFDAIIHAAAQPSHDYASDHVIEDFEVNARGTLNLLELTRKYSPEATFVYVSTDKVYGDNMQGEKLSDETLGLDFAGKRSLFGCSKAAADMYVQEYGNYFGMKTVCFRPGCITGRKHEGAEQHGFLAYVAKCVREGKEYTIFNNAVRDQIHARDLAAAFWHYIEFPYNGAQVYNIGGGPERALNVEEALLKCSEFLHKVPKFTYGPKRKGDRDYDIHDVSKFKKDYPEWDYEYSLQDIIEDICQK